MCLEFILHIKSQHIAFGLGLHLRPEEKMFSLDARLLSNTLVLAAVFSAEVRFWLDFEPYFTLQQYDRSTLLLHLRRPTWMQDRHRFRPVGLPWDVIRSSCTTLFSKVECEHLEPIRDSTTLRALRIASTSSASMTIESCLAFCTPEGYKYAGVEYGRVSFCWFFILSTYSNLYFVESVTSFL